MKRIGNCTETTTVIITVIIIKNENEIVIDKDTDTDTDIAFLSVRIMNTPKLTMLEMILLSVGNMNIITIEYHYNSRNFHFFTIFFLIFCSIFFSISIPI